MSERCGEAGRSTRDGDAHQSVRVERHRLRADNGARRLECGGPGWRLRRRVWGGVLRGRCRSGRPYRVATRYAPSFGTLELVLNWYDSTMDGNMCRWPHWIKLVLIGSMGGRARLGDELHVTRLAHRGVIALPLPFPLPVLPLLPLPFPLLPLPLSLPLRGGDGRPRVRRRGSRGGWSSRGRRHVVRRRRHIGHHLGGVQLTRVRARVKSCLRMSLVPQHCTTTILAKASTTILYHILRSHNFACIVSYFKHPEWKLGSVVLLK